ncbi:hypothetical protein GOP47_0026070 [Adiantum capillus-veneris]|uniref:Reverse transcriptase zinc-binding domain-containing protein n=1 Tax=Adiantum capillus-veneris TaxID=13818 RepID=A0A9D4U182_ADICA|nr:hypothetical protein GOP47_0026070 [Adiantum capillus-veneris]
MKSLREWVLERVLMKVASWHYEEWPLHVRLWIIRAILLPCILYYIPLLDWTEKSLQPFKSALARFLWGKKKASAAPITWDCLTMPMKHGGLGILNLTIHAHARRGPLMKHMVQRDTYWSLCLWYLIDCSVVYFHGTWNITSWDNLFTAAPIKIGFIVSQMLITSWKIIASKLQWNGRQRYTGNSLGVESVFWSHVFQTPPAMLIRKKALSMFKKGIVQINQIMDASHIPKEFLVSRREFRLGNGLRISWNHLCALVHPLTHISLVNTEDRHKDWQLPSSHASWWSCKTDKFYASLHIEVDVAIRCNQQWTLQSPFKLKVFMWRVVMGAIPSVMLMLKKGNGTGACSVCHRNETVRHIFWDCSQVREWWQWFKFWWNQAWGIKFTCMFGFFKTQESAMLFCLHSFRLWYVWYIWNMRNISFYDHVHVLSTRIPSQEIKNRVLEDVMTLRDKELQQRSY